MVDTGVYDGDDALGVGGTDGIPVRRIHTVDFCVLKHCSRITIFSVGHSPLIWRQVSGCADNDFFFCIV